MASGNFSATSASHRTDVPKLRGLALHKRMHNVWITIIYRDKVNRITARFIADA